MRNLILSYTTTEVVQLLRLLLLLLSKLFCHVRQLQLHHLNFKLNLLWPRTTYEQQDHVAVVVVTHQYHHNRSAGSLLAGTKLIAIQVSSQSSRHSRSQFIVWPPKFNSIEIGSSNTTLSSKYNQPTNRPHKRQIDF